MPSPDLAFAFTESDTPDVRARIEEDLRLVAKRVQAADPRLVALVLTGGFSRGEGTVRDGKPVNDYDLVAVRSTPGGRGMYRTLGHDLSREVGIEVDLMPIVRARLSRVGRKLFWLDLKQGGRVILGEARVLDRVRTFPAADLHPVEPARLLGNRAVGLLLAVPTAFEPVDAALRDLQATKAALAAMDAALLSQGKYDARLRGRLDLARGLPDHAIFARAVQWKLGGSREAMDASWWTSTRDALLRAVARTNAERARDGPIEIAYHALAARRLRAHPSADIRREAWALLGRTEYPRGPEGWDTLKPAFLARRARTLQ